MRNRFEAFAGCILELNRCLLKIKELEMKPFGLRASHTMCLYYLGKNGAGLTATQLTELCREDKSAVSRCLSQLLGKGLIYCNLPENKRAYRTLFYLTENGQKLVKRMNRRIESVLLRGGIGLTETQRNVFYDTMELILTNLITYLNEQENHRRPQNNETVTN